MHHMLKYFVAILLSVCSIITCFADDSYDPATGILTVGIVNIGGTTGAFYTNVTVTVDTILTINSANRPPPGYDTYDPATNKLGIPTVIVGGGTTYTNVYVTVGNIIAVGAKCETPEACGVTVPSSPSVETGSGGSTFATSTINSCAAGTYFSNASCKSCAAGTYSAARAISCTSCAAGTYSAAKASSCKSCDVGLYWDGAKCRCPDGQNLTASGTCIACTGGAYWTGSACGCSADQKLSTSNQCESICASPLLWNGTKCISPSS